MTKQAILINFIIFLSIMTGCGSGAVIEEGPPLLIDDLGTVEMSYRDFSSNDNNLIPLGGDEYLYFASNVELDRPHAEVGRITVNQPKDIRYQSDEFWINALFWDRDHKQLVLGTEAWSEDGTEKEYYAWIYDESGNEIAKLAMQNRVASITKEGQSYFIRTETSEGSSVFECSMEGQVVEQQVFEKPFTLTVLLNNSEGIALGYDLDRSTRTPFIVLSQDGEEAERISIPEKNAFPVTALQKSETELDCILETVKTRKRINQLYHIDLEADEPCSLELESKDIERIVGGEVDFLRLFRNGGRLILIGWYGDYPKITPFAVIKEDGAETMTLRVADRKLNGTQSRIFMEDDVLKWACFDSDIGGVNSRIYFYSMDLK